MKFFTEIINHKRPYNSKDAYDLWSQSYDDERDNLMLHYDKIILNALMSKIDLTGKTILDYGCGTGRNWNDLLKHHPERIIGCDVSAGMLDRLKSKYEDAETYLVDDDEINFLSDNSCDVIISTLVIAHVENIEKLFSEWNRILKNGGNAIVTDFHPDLLAAGGTRTFKHGNKSLAIKNYIHPVPAVEKVSSAFGFEKIVLIEKDIDETVKPFYERHNALHIYNQYKGLPFIYGILLTKSNVD